MTIEEAVEALLSSKEFKDAANKDSNLRVAAMRLKNEGVKYGKAIDLLLQFGYSIEVKKKKPS